MPSPTSLMGGMRRARSRYRDLTRQLGKSLVWCRTVCLGSKELLAPIAGAVGHLSMSQSSSHLFPGFRVLAWLFSILILL